MDTALYDLAPAARLALLGVVIAVAPLAWLWLRHRRTAPASRLRALTLLTLFLTFDLVLFGAFTRLTDSGLGCPDWPGCYGSSSPIGARDEIHAAQTAMPTGPVTHGKAWIEMVHRYLAMTVGVLITVLMIASWLLRRRDSAAVVSPWWATATFAWVCVQGAFGALTVTMKLYPAIVTAHLLGGITGVMLLAAQAQAGAREPVVLSPGLRFAARSLLALLIAQCALGGWVSANYAVLACTDFPTCQGSWWPPMDFGHAFVLRRELGLARDGSFLPFAALTAIHYVHRLVAYVVLLAMALLAWRLARAGAAGLRRFALALAGLALWQLASGLSNVVLDWPIVAALAHTAGAAAAVALLTVLLVRAGGAPRPEQTAAGAPVLSRRTA
jgi:cytochrome c oxidase assembly protein subunit 15